MVQQESCDVAAILKMWDDSPDWSAAMDSYMLFRRDFSLFRMLIQRVPWETALKTRGMEEWTYFKKEIFKTQEQALPMC